MNTVLLMDLSQRICIFCLGKKIWLVYVCETERERKGERGREGGFR